MISDVIWRYEVDGHGRFVGSYISPVADRMLGVKRQLFVPVSDNYSSSSLTANWS
jgi:hypothetical protein